MGKYILTVLLLAAAQSASAQTITLDSVTIGGFCTGSDVLVAYHASGPFQAGNHFVLQSSDATGSFGHFTNLAFDSSGVGIIRTTWTQTGDHIRLRVVSTAPYTLSADNGYDISVMGTPTSGVKVWRPTFNEIAYISVPGKPVRFISQANTGDSIVWHFSPDATPLTSTQRQPAVSFSTPGWKWGKLTATNRAGCSRTDSGSVFIASCHPVIPAATRFVTGSVVGDDNDTSVLVKAGGTYTVNGTATVYVEAGGSVKSGSFQSGSLIYLLNGASQQFDYLSRANFVMGKDLVFGLADDPFDTVRCDDLSFDYSQLTNDVANESWSSGRLIVTANSDIRWTGAGPIALQVLSIVGLVVLQRTIDAEHPLSVSGLPRGAYIVRSMYRSTPTIRFVR